MRIICVKGGLGNQMFQCAFALALKNKFPREDVLIDTRLYRFPFIKTFRGNNFYHNGFEINKLFPNFVIPIANIWKIVKVSYYIPNYIVSQAIRKIIPCRKKEYVQDSSKSYFYDDNLLQETDFSYFDGYWLSPLYFDFCKDDILKAFEFRPFDTFINLKLAEELKSVDSVAVHVRRGDYLNIPLYKDICSVDYYRNAIYEVRRIIRKPVFYIFSNDPTWCREHLKKLLGDSKVIYVTNNKGESSYRDMQLMSLARCVILANSSFSWWGAYLNKRDDHVIFCPQKWVNGPCDDACCKEWIKVRN